MHSTAQLKKMLVFVTVPELSGYFLISQRISSVLEGNNKWYINPSNQVWELAGQAGLTSLRIGRHAYDDNMPSKSQFPDWVKRNQAMGAEPIMQVSQYGTPEVAAELVKYFNLESNGNQVPIKYYNICNEPWLQVGRPPLSSGGALVEGYFKPIAAVIKDVDPGINTIPQIN